MMANRPEPARESATSWMRVTAQWLAVVVPPLASFAQQQISYSLVSPSCTSQTIVLLHLPTIGMLALIALATAYSWRQWTRDDGRETSNDRRELASTHFFALLGLTMSGMATIVVLAQWLPTLFLHPCVR